MARTGQFTFARMGALGLSIAMVFGACSASSATPSPAASVAPGTPAATSVATPAATNAATAATAAATPTAAATSTAPPAASPSAAAGGGGTFIGSWAGPCCNGTDWLTPWDGGGGPGAHWLNKIYGRLTTYTVKDQAYDKLVGDLAESWSISEDKLTWTFNLRKGVTWHDGAPFTADDVKFSFELGLNPKNSMAPCAFCGPLNTLVGAEEVLAGTTTDIAGVKVIDATTLALTFTAPNALFPDTISELFILPKHELEQIPPEEMKTTTWWATKQIGTGPFKWDKYTPTQSIELVPFADYWRGAPKLDRLIRREFQDTNAALLAFDNGEVHFTYVTADEVARESSNPNGTVLPGGSGVDNVIFYNPVRHPEFANPIFRQALLTAIDRPAIVENIYGGGAELVPCLYGRPNLTGDVEQYAYDPAKAKELLAESGVDPAALGELTMITYYRDQLSGNVISAILKNWSDVLGIKGKMEQLEDAAYGAAAQAGDYDISFVGAANGPTGNRAFDYFHSSRAFPAGGNGFPGYSYGNAELDKLLEAGVSEFDTAKQDAIYQQACQLMHEDLPWIFLWETVRYHVVSTKVHNMILIPAAGGGSYYDAAETWTVDE